MIVAITGATGAIGRKLVEQHLEAGDVVRALTRQPQSDLPAAVEVHCGGLASDPGALARFVDGANVLYHCAAEIHDPNRMMDVNALGTQNLARAAQTRIGRWVQLGSIATYGAPQNGVITEDTPPQPVDVYGRSKTEGDRIVLEAAREHAFDCCVIRPAKVFGAGIEAANNQILFRLFTLIDRRFFFFIGAPGALTHYVHFENLVDALVRCGRCALPGARVYNLSDDCPIEVFVATIAAGLGRRTPTLRLPERPVRWLARAFGTLPGFPLHEKRIDALMNRAAFPIDRLERELGYVHRVPVQSALRELVDMWRCLA